jgi:hypothetical protein
MRRRESGRRGAPGDRSWRPFRRGRSVGKLEGCSCPAGEMATVRRQRSQGLVVFRGLPRKLRAAIAARNPPRILSLLINPCVSTGLGRPRRDSPPARRAGHARRDRARLYFPWGHPDDSLAVMFPRSPRAPQAMALAVPQKDTGMCRIQGHALEKPGKMRCIVSSPRVARLARSLRGTPIDRGRYAYLRCRNRRYVTASELPAAVDPRASSALATRNS